MIEKFVQFNSKYRKYIVGITGITLMIRAIYEKQYNNSTENYFAIMSFTLSFMLAFNSVMKTPAYNDILEKIYKKLEGNKKNSKPSQKSNIQSKSRKKTRIFGKNIKQNSK